MNAAQRSRHGHSGQRGRRGVHSVAPRSIIACAKSPVRRSGVSVRARASISGRAAGRACSIACSRATTLSTLPSTGVVGRSKAIAAIAARCSCRFPAAVAGTLRLPETAGVARRDSSCASMQIAHPRVIAEALPSMQNLVQLRRSEIFEARPACRNDSKYGVTAATVVCCSMISLIHTRYESARARRSPRQIRRSRSYQPTSSGRCRRVHSRMNSLWRYGLPNLGAETFMPASSAKTAMHPPKSKVPQGLTALGETISAVAAPMLGRSRGLAVPAWSPNGPRS